MRLRWLPEAWQDVERLYDFLMQQNPGAAADAIDVILGASERLLDAPEIGRPMNDGEGRRELFTIFGADSLETSIYETAHHWRYKLLEDTDWQSLDGVVIERKIYLVRCDAALLDFRPKLDAFPGLIDPAPNGYYLTQQVGARIHHDGHPGLISRSARCAGDVYAIFNPQVLSNPRQVCYLTYRIEGGSVSVERQPGQVLLRI